LLKQSGGANCVCHQSSDREQAVGAFFVVVRRFALGKVAEPKASRQELRIEEERSSVATCFGFGLLSVFSSFLAAFSTRSILEAGGEKQPSATRLNAVWLFFAERRIIAGKNGRSNGKK